MFLRLSANSTAGTKHMNRAAFTMTHGQHKSFTLPSLKRKRGVKRREITVDFNCFIK
jgi:hypothetical protein